MCRIEPMVDKFLGQLVKEPRHSVALFVIGEINGYGTAMPHWYYEYGCFIGIIKALDVAGILEAVHKEWLPKSLLIELLNEQVDADAIYNITRTLTPNQRALFLKLLKSFKEHLLEDAED